jgi:hypothetical protein
MIAKRLAALPRWLLVLLPMLALLMAAQVGSNLKPAAVGMTEAAQKWLGLLSAEEKAIASFPFDHAERTAWYFVPLQDKDKKPTRKGLRLEVMNDAQKAAAMGLVQSALSETGFRKVQTIMSLENVLIDQEKGKGPVRNPNWYFLTLFGTPCLEGTWGWRIEGHHLSLNFTIKDGKVASITPAFFGSNPGEVKAGEKQGTRPLATSLDNALSLIKSLNDEQKKAALQSKAFPEVQGQTVSAKIGAPVGVSYQQLQPDQQKAMRQLAESYLENFHPDLQKTERDRLAEAGWDAVTFAYSGTSEPGTPLTYRLQGPKVLVEFINLQADGAGNKNNHYHTSWRTLPSDFGMTQAAK